MKNNQQSESMSGKEITLKLEELNNILARLEGRDIYEGYFNVFRGLKRVNNEIVLPDIDHRGYIFISRPVLNLSTSSLRNDRVMTLVDTLDPNSINFAIRCYLDTDFCKRNYVAELISKSNFINSNLFFIPILSNNWRSISGWIDSMIETETLEGGFHGETLSIPKGTEDGKKVYDISVTFRDIIGSPILLLFLIWKRFITLSKKGRLSPYQRYNTGDRMCYTCSIYRFTMDTTGRYIKKYAKATGCFPKSFPDGTYFNADENTIFINAGNSVSVPFSVNGRIEKFDPIILLDFNLVTKKFCPNIENMRKLEDEEEKMIFGHYAVPYINISQDGYNELEWRVDDSALPSDPRDDFEIWKQSIKNK